MYPARLTSPQCQSRKIGRHRERLEERNHCWSLQLRPCAAAQQYKIQSQYPSCCLKPHPARHGLPSAPHRPRRCYCASTSSSSSWRCHSTRASRAPSAIANGLHIMNSRLPGSTDDGAVPATVCVTHFHLCGQRSRLGECTVPSHLIAFEVFV